MRDILAAILLLTGGSFTLLAAVGLLRLPDLFTRMHAATKSGTLGVGCTVAAVAMYFDQFAVLAQATLIITFLFLTAPIAAHLIGRAAYLVRVPQWPGTVIDELEGRYDRKNQTLASSAPETAPIDAPLPQRTSKT